MTPASDESDTPLPEFAGLDLGPGPGPGPEKLPDHPVFSAILAGLRDRAAADDETVVAYYEDAP
ncbi:hypothetical protein [Streptomyces sp. 8N616]|uniref:hypothetical protein n=1 Tax=Streptomyces sp. 8N616 TaxID=3457414 RepID=UPI003FD46C3B